MALDCAAKVNNAEEKRSAYRVSRNAYPEVTFTFDEASVDAIGHKTKIVSCSDVLTTNRD